MTDYDVFSLSFALVWPGEDDVTGPLPSAVYKAGMVYLAFGAQELEVIE